MTTQYLLGNKREQDETKRQKNTFSMNFLYYDLILLDSYWRTSPYFSLYSRKFLAVELAQLTKCLEFNISTYKQIIANNLKNSFQDCSTIQ